MSVSPRARFGDPPDRRTRGMLCTRAAALSQVQQPAGQPPMVAGARNHLSVSRSLGLRYGGMRQESSLITMLL